jgi:WD40 repeat protein
MRGRQPLGGFGHLSHVSPAAFAPDGPTRASGSSDRTVHLWNVGQAGANARTVLRVAEPPGGK